MSCDSALNLANSSRQGLHVHLLKFLNWGEWVQQFGNESIEEFLIILSKSGLRHDCRLVIRWCIVILIFINRLFGFFCCCTTIHRISRLLLFLHLVSDALLDLSFLFLLSPFLLFHSRLLLLFLFQETLFLLFQHALLLLDLGQFSLLLLESLLCLIGLNWIKPIYPIGRTASLLIASSIFT